MAVIIGFDLIQPTPPPADDLVSSAIPASEAGGTTGSVVPDVSEATESAVEAPAAQLAAEVEEEIVLDFGRPGDVGHYRARFSNRGAQLRELRTGTYFRQAGLSEEQQADPRYWLPLVEDVELRDGGRPAGGLAMRVLGLNSPLTATPLSDVLWVAERLPRDDGSDRGVEFRYRGAEGVTFVKRIEAVEGSWELAVTLGIESPQALPEGLSAGPLELAMVAAGTVGVEVEDSFYKQPRALAVGPVGGRSMDLESAYADLGTAEVKGVLEVAGPLAVVGGANKYFTVLLRGVEQQSRTVLRSAGWRRFDAFGLVPPNEHLGEEVVDEQVLQGYIAADAQMLLELPAAGQRKDWNFHLYAGPKDHGAFLDLDPAHKEVINGDLSWFSGIGNFLTGYLNLLQRLVGNWGVAIILLTLSLRLVLFPINRRAQTAMARYQSKMKRLKPKLDAMKEKYKDDPKKLQEAQAKFMQEERAFPPLGGCLPLFLQMPVFFGLFAALRTSFDLRHADFAFWIHDLSRPDQFMYWGVNVPLFGEYLNLLPPLMVVMWIWQQKSMPQPTDEQAKQMQRIMLFMPPAMGVFLYNYAAGLSLYMVTTSTFGIIEQKVIKKLWPIDDTEQEPKGKGGCAPFAEAMQRAAEQQQQRQKELERQKSQLQKRKQQRKNR